MAGERGFTLVESMVVLMVIGIILGVTIPAFNSYRLTMVRNRTRGQVIEDLRGARQKAVTQHTPVVVAFGDGVSTANLTSYTVHSDTNGDGVKQSTELILWKSVPRDSKLSNVDLQPKDTLMFNVSGTLRTGTRGGTIVMKTGKFLDTLAVSITGMVYRP